MSNEKDPLKSSLKNAKGAMDEAKRQASETASDAVDPAKDKLKQMSTDIKKDQQGKEK